MYMLVALTEADSLEHSRKNYLYELSFTESTSKLNLMISII